MKLVFVLVLLLVLLLVFVGRASATDYYVATWGDNIAQGNITHPWQNVSYATQQAVAGDTIYLFDGIWYDEHAVFANSGNATHQITLTSYNGTPTLDGVDRTGRSIEILSKDYINIIGPMLIINYACAVAFGNSDHGNLSNIEATANWDPADGYDQSLIQAGNCHYITISDCTFHNSSWNTVSLGGNREPPNDNGIPATHLTIRNCTIHDSHTHNAIDLFGNLQHVLIEENRFYNNIAGNIYNHHAPDYTENLIIRNNNFYGAGGVSAINLYDAPAHNVAISNNTCYNFTGEVFAIANSHNYTIQYNEIYNCQAGPRFYGTSYNILFNRNYMTNGLGYYRITGGATATIRNPFGEKMVGLYSGGNASLEFDDGTVFIATPNPDYSAFQDVRYHPASSFSTINQTVGMFGGGLYPVVTYNITLCPVNAYLKDVSIDHESDAADDRTNITVNSSVTTNPTWINATMQNASANYSVSVDGVVVDYVDADANAIVRYQYTLSWSAHDFEFEWMSAASFSPCHSKIYYNTTSPILNTVNSTGYVLWNRTITEDDSVVSSLLWVVTT